MIGLDRIHTTTSSENKFSTADNYYKPVKIPPNLQLLRETDKQALPAEIERYVNFLYTHYKNPQRTVMAMSAQLLAERKTKLDVVLKRICEVYAISLLVCDSLKTRITFLKQQTQPKKIKVPLLSYQHARKYSNEIAQVLQRVLARAAATSTQPKNACLTETELAKLNSCAKFIIAIYNSSALGIFRKQPVRNFNSSLANFVR